MNRAEQAQQVRKSAADLARSRGPVAHIANSEEYEYRNKDGQPSHIANFTKGLPHDTETGLLLNPVDYQLFIRGIDSGTEADFLATPLGPAARLTEAQIAERPDDCPTETAFECNQALPEAPWESELANTGGEKCGRTVPVEPRAWEAAAVGRTFDLEGPDALAVTMPPAPRLDSRELAAEMCEVYAQALLRDQHVSQFRDPIGKHGPIDAKHDYPLQKDVTGITVEKALDLMNGQEWFGLTNADPKLSDAERKRLRGQVTRQNAFRGLTRGDDIGPYISQFLLIGNIGINSANASRDLRDGKITYGAIRIDQRVRVAVPKCDYLTDFASFIDAQNGARFNGMEAYVPKDCPLPYRFMTSPRDLATYVHYDALYEAYLNACLIMLSLEVPFDRGLPFQRNDIADHQQGFAQFGGPHILSLVCEVATRALKAVRFQKFNVHRRLRPEALAARIAKAADFPQDAAFHPVRPMAEALSGPKTDGKSILDWVSQHNEKQTACQDNHAPLLPMAFPEGSPMHPAYGAGHATVAGACVTILKAFFDAGSPLLEKVDGSESRPIMYEANQDGSSLVSLVEDAPYGENIPHSQSFSLGGAESPHPAKRNLLKYPKTKIAPLTVEGELNKLASNISIGRDWAGVHYYTDYIESLRMGEEIAIGLLEEQKLTYRENFSMTIPLFDGGSIRI